MLGLHEDGQGDYSHTQFFLVFLQIPKQKWVIANIKWKLRRLKEWHAPISPWYRWRKIGHVEKFQISIHDRCGEMWNFSTCRGFSNFLHNKLEEFYISPCDRCEESWNLTCFVLQNQFCGDSRRYELGPIKIENFTSFDNSELLSFSLFVIVLLLNKDVFGHCTWTIGKRYTLFPLKLADVICTKYLYFFG